MGLYQKMAAGLNGLLGGLGYRVVRLPTPPENCRIRAIERLGIDLVIDVGANIGQYARWLRNVGYRGRIVSFEPLPDAFAALAAVAREDPLWEVRNVAVGAAPGRLHLHVAANSVSSSLLPVTRASIEAAPASLCTGSVEVEVIRLEEELAFAADRRILLKIDSQGYEWPILRGCGETLAQVSMIDVEMSLEPLYEGQALFDAVDRFILDSGFRRFGFDTSFWDKASGRLLQLDGIYVRL